MALPDVLTQVGPRLAPGYDTAWIDVADNQVIKYGDFLVLSSGEAAQAATAATTASTLTTTGSTVTILGIALTPVTTTTGVADTDKVFYAVANDKLRFELRFYGTTSSNAEAQDATIGATYGLERWTPASGTADAFYVAMIGETSSTNLLYMERDVTSALGDDYGLGWFKCKTRVMA